MTKSGHVHHPENDTAFIGLSVNKGIEHPEAVNKDSVNRFLKKNKNKELTSEQYCEGILQGCYFN
jgi:hypothetical protein